MKLRLALLMLAGWLVRHLVALTYWGHAGDITTFKSWALRMAIYGPNDFYLLQPGQPPGIPCDYPPLYPYLLGGIGAFYGWLGDSLPPDDSFLFTFLIKYPAILAELALAMVVFALLRRHATPGVAWTGLALTLFNPALILDTAGAGQINPFVALMQLVGLWAALSRRHAWAIGITGLAILLKPQGIILAPLIGWLAARDQAWRSIVLGILGAFALVYLVTLPYLWGKLPVGQWLPWLWNHYLAQAHMYPFSSAMAFNAWAPWGYWDQMDDRLLFGLTHRMWGLLAFAGVYLAALAAVWRRRDAHTVLVAALLILLAFFLFPTRMHERYLYYALVMLGLMAAGRPQWLVPWFWFGLSFALNLTFVLAWPFGAQVQQALEAGGDLAVAWINVAMFGYCALLAIRQRLYDEGRWQIT